MQVDSALSGVGVIGNGTGTTLDGVAVRTAVAPRFLRAAQSLPAAGRLKLRRPVDMARVPMIHVVSFPHAWPQWLSRAGVRSGKARQAVWCDGFEAALQLAECRAGVALGLAPLFADREAAGMLCRLAGFQELADRRTGCASTPAPTRNIG